MTSVNLSKYDNSWFYIGAGKMKAIIWYFVNVFFINRSCNKTQSQHQISVESVNRRLFLDW